MDGNTMKTIQQTIYFIDTIEEYMSIPKTNFLKLKNVDFPVLSPIMVHSSLVEANDYNPNHVAKDKMELLKISILQNGFCFGIVSIFDANINKFVIIDGDHRNQITGKDWLNIEYKPLIILNHSMDKRLSATMQFNKARGVHRVEGNAELLKRMVDSGASDMFICKTLGIDADELLRLKRLKKIADVYKDGIYSNSWEIEKQ